MHCYVSFHVVGWNQTQVLADIKYVLVEQYTYNNTVKSLIHLSITREVTHMEYMVKALSYLPKMIDNLREIQAGLVYLAEVCCKSTAQIFCFTTL